MADLGDILGDLSGFTDDLKDYGLMAAGAVGARMAYGFVGNKVGPMLPASLGAYAKPLLYGVEVVAGVMSAKYLRKLNPAIAQGAAIGLVADGLVGLLTTLAPSTFGAGMTLSVGQGSLGAGPRRQFRAAPVSVQRLRAAPVSVQRLGGFGAAPSRVAASMVAAV